MKNWMKKAGSLLLTLALVLTFVPTVAFADGQVKVSAEDNSVDVSAIGTTVGIDVSLDENPGIVNLVVDVAFDNTSLQFNGISNQSDTLTGFDGATNAASIANANTNGKYRLSWANDLVTENITATGRLAHLEFELKEGATVGKKTIALTFPSGSTYDVDFNAPATSATDGSVTVYCNMATVAVAGLDAPAKNAAPDTAVTVSEGATVTSVEWYAGSTKFTGAQFAGDTAYTAKVTVKPNAGYNFTAGTTFTLNGETVTATDGAEGAKVLEKTFDKTLGKELTGIAVTTQPTKTAYEYGDAFDPAGMVITGTFDDSSTETITGYTTSPETFTTIGSGQTVTFTYGGQTATTTVDVTAKSITDATITLGTALTYNGSEQTQTVSKVELGGATLTAGTDYTVSGNTGTNAGDYTLTITGTGNYTGTATKSFTIAKKTIDLSQYTWNYSGALTYSGSAQTVALASTNPDANYVSPVYGGTYTETNVGSYVATATVPSENVNSNYQTTGEIPNLNWTISAASNPATLSSTAQTVVRNHTLDLATLVSGAVEGTSYQFTIASGDAGAISGTVFTADATKTGAVTVNAKALALNKGGTDAPEYNEKDLGTIAITVIAKPEKNEKVTVSMADWTYGNPATPSASADSAISTATGPTYEYTGTGSTVYGPTPTRPEDIGTYQVKAYYETDEFLYYGTATFTVSAKAISDSTVTVATIADQEYTGAAIIPEVTVTDSQAGKTLVMGTDYELSGTSTNVGSATVVITGKGNYSGTRNENFTIVAKKLAKPTANTATFTYNGAEQTYTPVGFDANTMLISGNVQKNAGTYTVPVGLKDSTNYQWATSGDPEFTFTIAPKSLTYTATVADKTYDGTDKATVTDLALVGVEGSDVVTLTKDGATATLTGSIDAGANRPVKVVLTNPGLAGADNANYVLDSAFVYEGAITINPLTDTSAAPVAEESTGTIVSNQAPVADKKSVTYNVTVTPDGSNTTGLVKMVMPLPAGTTAGYTFKVSFNGTSYNATVTSSGLVVELPAGSGEAIVTWTAPATSNDGGMFIINGNGIATPVSTTGSTGAMSVPTSLTGTIKKVTVDGKTVNSKNYTVTGNTVVLSEAFMKTLSNGKHTVKISDATNTYTVTVNVNKAGVKSATTGDAGIALYAVMALSSAAGAVWVTRKNKKED